MDLKKLIDLAKNREFSEKDIENLKDRLAKAEKKHLEQSKPIDLDFKYTL